MQIHNLIYIRELEHFFDMPVGTDMQLTAGLLDLTGRHDDDADAGSRCESRR